jgi:hydrogenase large subunit
MDGMPGTDNLLVPRGVILDRDLSKIHDMTLDAPDEVQEFVSHAWYDYSTGKDSGLHPWDGETKLAYDGPEPPFKHLDMDANYTWLKAPRWRGKPMEVGPLARVLILYASGHEPTRDLADNALSQLDLPLEAMFSTMGRVAARTLETKIVADAMSTWMDSLMGNINAGDTRTQNSEMWEPETWPSEAKGAGYMEAPRGALCHWIVIKDEKIANYQAVVPSTWNAGPRDADGQEGPYEASLVGHDLVDPHQPLEILRTIHSFDPCLACAVHVADKDSGEAVDIKVA